MNLKQLLQEIQADFDTEKFHPIKQALEIGREKHRQSVKKMIHDKDSEHDYQYREYGQSLKLFKKRIKETKANLRTLEMRKREYQEELIDFQKKYTELLKQVKAQRTMPPKLSDVKRAAKTTKFIKNLIDIPSLEETIKNGVKELLNVFPEEVRIVKMPNKEGYYAIDITSTIPTTSIHYSNLIARVSSYSRGENSFLNIVRMYFNGLSGDDTAFNKNGLQEVIARETKMPVERIVFETTRVFVDSKKRTPKAKSVNEKRLNKATIVFRVMFRGI